MTSTRVNAAAKALVAAGATEPQPVRDHGNIKLVGTWTDTDGDSSGLIQES